MKRILPHRMVIGRTNMHRFLHIITARMIFMTATKRGRIVHTSALFARQYSSVVLSNNGVINVKGVNKFISKVCCCSNKMIPG